jgi:hypothetical protein
MNRPLITLTTDFGEGSPFIAAMKGVMWSIDPDTRVVDLTHSVPAQDIRQGALALRQTALYFPPGTIHVAVVDPGVGTDRAIVYVEMAGHRFIAPDNGLLGLLAAEHPPTKIIRVENSDCCLPDVSATFHGRDVMAPVAAWLGSGFSPEKLGPATERLTQLNWPEVCRMPQSVEGEVVTVDSFGNLITNITRGMLVDVPTDESVVVRCDGHETRGLFTTYGDQPPMTLLALFGSSGSLELAVVNDNAAAMLGARVGTKVIVAW